MNEQLQRILVDPEEHQLLRLEEGEVVNGTLVSGRFRAANDMVYPIREGIPRFVATKDEGQQQTSDSFAFKWKRRDTYDSPQSQANATRWYVEKYGYDAFDDWAGYFANRRAILDVGCGSGFSSSLWLRAPAWTGRAMWVGADISGAIDVAAERLANVPNTHFIQADALRLPFRDGEFDTVFSEGVFHHTPSTRAALFSAVRVAEPGGELHFYVYRRKGPIREFTDDYIRQQISSLSDEASWDAMRSITSLGRALACLHTEVVLEEDVPLLGIKAGRHDLQRLVYWNFAKVFWNEKLSFEENVHVNFDWYRPHFAHRQTAEEVRQWCEEAHVRVTWFHEEESGFTVRAVKE